MHNKALNEVTRYLNKELESVNDIIKDSLKSNVDIINDVSSHIQKSGGKKIRPMLVLASAKLYLSSVDDQLVAYLAAAIELIHNATLLHDDVVDDNNLRRGIDNTKGIWGNQISVLVGDLLFSIAFKLLVKCNSIEATSAVSNVAFSLSEGEIKQLTNIGKIISEEEYIKTISLKTASLFGLSCSIVALMEKKTDYEKMLYDFGLNLGIAFQLMDDILDYDNSSSIGKTIGNDFFNSKVTLPIIIAYELSNNIEKTFLDQTFSNQNKANNIEKILLMLKEKSVFVKCIAKIQPYIDNCINILQYFPNVKIRSLILDLLDFFINRKF